MTCVDIAFGGPLLRRLNLRFLHCSKGRMTYLYRYDSYKKNHRYLPVSLPPLYLCLSVSISVSVSLPLSSLSLSLWSYSYNVFRFVFNSNYTSGCQLRTLRQGTFGNVWAHFWLSQLGGMDATGIYGPGRLLCILQHPGYLPATKTDPDPNANSSTAERSWTMIV